jgi:hypothetical protein
LFIDFFEAVRKNKKAAEPIGFDVIAPTDNKFRFSIENYYPYSRNRVILRIKQIPLLKKIQIK